jgi:hypothetical protein
LKKIVLIVIAACILISLLNVYNTNKFNTENSFSDVKKVKGYYHITINKNKMDKDSIVFESPNKFHEQIKELIKKQEITIKDEVTYDYRHEYTIMTTLEQFEKFEKSLNELGIVSYKAKDYTNNIQEVILSKSIPDLKWDKTILECKVGIKFIKNVNIPIVTPIVNGIINTLQTVLGILFIIGIALLGLTLGVRYR